MSFLLLCFAMMAFTSENWEEDAKQLADTHCRTLEAEIKHKKSPDDVDLRASYGKPYNEMMVFSQKIEKKYKGNR